MSAHVILQTLGWIPVLWLLAVQVLVDRQRLPRDGVALRIAACAGAAVVIAVSIEENIWPLAGLGLLWLRTEVFAHRHPIHEFQAYREQARRDRLDRLHHLDHDDHEPVDHGRVDHGQVDHGPPPQRQPLQDELLLKKERLPENLTPSGPVRRREAGHTTTTSGPRTAPHLARQSAAYDAGRRTAYKADHPPHQQRLGPRAVNAIFKIEVIIVIIVALVALGSWAESHRSSFNHKANNSVCRLMGGC